jgi:phosphoribosylamine---glycine ligase
LAREEFAGTMPVVMRLLGIGSHCDLGDLYRRVLERGHEVRAHVADPDSSDVLLGIVPRGDVMEDDLAWCAEERGLVVFEGTGEGERQDTLRSRGHRVVGGSAFGDRLELDRAFGQKVLGSAGLRVAPLHEVNGWDEAIAFVLKHPARYVLKFSGAGFASTRTYVGVMDDGTDLLAALRTQRRLWTYAETPCMVLMAHVSGVEVGVGAYFNGHRFILPANLDWEHKRLFAGDLGELTGEMGTVVTYRGAERLFDATLARLEPLFREAGHVGYVNLNLIVNDDGVFPLEFTCRFGYPGYAILGALQLEPWERLLGRLADGDDRDLETQSGYAVGVVLTVPPFPYPDGYDRLSKGAVVSFYPLDDADRASLHYGELRKEGHDLVTAWQIGYVMVVTGTGAEVLEARDAALARARKVVVPNMRYRIDIGDRLVREDRARLVALGWLP